MTLEKLNIGTWYTFHSDYVIRYFVPLEKKDESATLYSIMYDKKTDRLTVTPEKKVERSRIESSYTYYNSDKLKPMVKEESKELFSLIFNSIII